MVEHKPSKLTRGFDSFTRSIRYQRGNAATGYVTSPTAKRSAPPMSSVVEHPWKERSPFNLVMGPRIPCSTRFTVIT